MPRMMPRPSDSGSQPPSATTSTDRQPGENVLDLRVPVAPLMLARLESIRDWHTGSHAGVAEEQVVLEQGVLGAAAEVERGKAACLPLPEQPAQFVRSPGDLAVAEDPVHQ